MSNIAGVHGVVPVVHPLAYSGGQKLQLQYQVCDQVLHDGQQLLVIPKWVKSRRPRRKRKKKKQAGFVEPHSSSTIGWDGVGLYVLQYVRRIGGDEGGVVCVVVVSSYDVE